MSETEREGEREKEREREREREREMRVGEEKGTRPTERQQWEVGTLKDGRQLRSKSGCAKARRVRNRPEKNKRRRNGGETSATQYDGQLRHHGEGERPAEGDGEELNGGGKVVELYGGR